MEPPEDPQNINLPAACSQQPAAISQKPAASSLQPAVGSQQAPQTGPAECAERLNIFCIALIQIINH